MSRRKPYFCMAAHHLPFCIDTQCIFGKWSFGNTGGSDGGSSVTTVLGEGRPETFCTNTYDVALIIVSGYKGYE